MSDNPAIAAFRGMKYLNLETLRKNGAPVRTPVWFAAAETGPAEDSPQKMYVYTIGESGKIKRIRNNARVRIAPCDGRGELKGDWVAAEAEILSGAEADHGMQLLNRKYFPWPQVLGFFARFRKSPRVVFILRPV